MSRKSVEQGLASREPRFDIIPNLFHVPSLVIIRHSDSDSAPASANRW